MPDDQLDLLFAQRAQQAVRHIDAPSEWRSGLPARARTRVRRARSATTLGTLAAAGVAAAIAVPLAESGGTTPSPGAPSLAAFTSALSTQSSRHRLPCMSEPIPGQSASAPALSVGQTTPGRASCTEFRAQEVRRVPRDADRVSEHVYLGRPTLAYRTGYVRYDSRGRQLVLAVAVGGSVPRREFVHLLDATVGLIYTAPTHGG